MEKQREKFGSRLGFILISAGCAIGLGNVWKFPYITGQYGGAAFVLIYFLFLLILGNIPTLILLAVYFVCREKFRKRNQIEKMKIQDLE